MQCISDFPCKFGHVKNKSLFIKLRIMKKVILFAVALMVNVAMSAQNYTHSVGVNVGGNNGFSYKGFVFGNENLALVADLGVGLTATPITTVVRAEGSSTTGKPDGVTTSMWDFSLNPNIVYQNPIAKGFSWFVGGGASLGMAKDFAATYEGNRYSVSNSDLLGKFGVNAIGGAEYKFADVPLVIGMDFRPGYGLIFRDYKKGGLTYHLTGHYFDWKIGASVRYCF